MTIPALTIIPAGAGSGKTYTLQTRLADWIGTGAIAADRIVAVTFTEAAGGELRDRIRAELVSQGRLDDALKLERSYISTIHGFGLRLLAEFGFEAGISPAPRLLSEDEEAVLIRVALAATERGEEVMGDLASYGYQYDFNSGDGPEDQFRKRVLELIARLRSIGRLEEDTCITSHALTQVTRLYGPTRSAAHLRNALFKAVSRLLTKFPEDLSRLFEGNATAGKDFRTDFASLKKAQQPDRLDQDWKLWQRLRTLRVSRRGSPTPAGYDDLAMKVMEAASSLPLHPGPLAQALRHVEGLLATSQDCLNRYAAGKREKGLVDYSDMLALSQRLLAERPDVLQELRSRVDCMVIDEFQDTNPLQFALMWSLFSAGVPTVVVGDLKQAIMGFQNADSRLLEHLIAQNQKRLAPLTGNWRSTPGLMKWVNRIGESLFGAAYTKLAPKASFPSSMTPLEVIDFPHSPAHGSSLIPAQHTAVRISDLLGDERQCVYDKHTKITRRLRGGDVAVICPTKSRLEKYAEALRALGIKTRMEEGGWFGSRAVQLAFHALSYVADPGDRHAALYLAVTELGRYDLETAMTELLDGAKLTDPVIEKLDLVAPALREAPVTRVVASVLEALDLYGCCSYWPDGAAARANLLRLQGEAAEFAAANPDALASGRYYGNGLKTFLAWLRGKVERDDKQPPPRVIDEDAVVLTTWHSSKGREWPVVAVCSTDAAVAPRLPDIGVVYECFDDLSAVLEQARIAISPDFAAPETREKFEEPLCAPLGESALRLLYVALTRAREKVILECHRYQKPETVSYWNILQQAGDIEIAGNKMSVGGKRFECRVLQASKNSPEEFEEEADVEVDPLPGLGRRAIMPGSVPPPGTPEAVVPSSLHGTEQVRGAVTVESYGTPLKVDLGMQGAERGLFLHRCFEVASADQATLRRVCESFGVRPSQDALAVVEHAATQFRGWLHQRFTPERVDSEMPVLTQDENGSVVAGSADLVIQGRDGVWIVDHKSDRSDELDRLFAHYAPQLQCYAKALAKAGGTPVAGIAINWISHGKVSLLPARSVAA